MDENIANEIKTISLSDVKALYRKNEIKHFIASASVNGVQKTILIFEYSKNTDNTWGIKYENDDGTKGIGIISDEDKQAIDAANRISVSEVVLLKPKDVGVIKLVTHTCVNTNYYGYKDAQRILIEKSEFSFKARFNRYVKANKKTNPFFSSGDQFIKSEEETISFIIIGSLPRRSETDDSGNEQLQKWKIRYSYANNVAEGVISDESSQNQIIQAVNNACKRLPKRSLKACELEREDDENNRFKLVSFPGFHNKSFDKKAIVYSIECSNLSDYYIETGLFCGLINFGDKIPPLEIRTEYSDTLVMRMIDRCCGIYADTKPADGDPLLNSFYSKIVQYMYLLSLRKVISILVPRKYTYLCDRGYNIRGNVDINAYVNHDLIAKDKKISYIYPERREIQSIIDVMYSALKCCKVTKNSSLLNLKGYEDYLESVYSGRYPSKNIIKNIRKETVLRTGLYSEFKRPLELASMLLENSELNTGNAAENQGISALLMDSSYLWETYLESIMRVGLTGWQIDAQSTIDYYKNTFYSKENRPDFILTNNESGEKYILDAKFKHMAFRAKDVDNDDVQQLHCYSYYFFLTEGKKFRGTALIYPTRLDQTVFEQSAEKKDNYTYIFGTDYATENLDCDQKFGIITLKDANECEHNYEYNETFNELSESEILDHNERVFIERLESFFEACRSTE